MLHFEMQGEAEEGADENNQAKDDDAVERGIYDNGVDDVARDKEFESQQNGTTHILSTKTICPNRVASSRGKRNRTVAMVAPTTMMATPVTSTAVPTTSMTSRKS